MLELKSSLRDSLRRKLSRRTPEPEGYGNSPGNSPNPHITRRSRLVDILWLPQGMQGTKCYICDKIFRVIFFEECLWFCFYFLKLFLSICFFNLFGFFVVEIFVTFFKKMRKKVMS